MEASELSPTGYPESPLEEDEIFLCKGCGEILEQGRAFELAGHRWHLTCFRCHSCGTLLDSDANLLLLGDGSLICNNCTYSCSSCGNKIEDLAILTGDQAFCATCFKCRNCKRKIENLRYARTSQGIFCMSCHESLMARRRKKAKQSRQTAAGASGSIPMVLDKSLPALPPNAVPQSALQSQAETPPSDSYTDTPETLTLPASTYKAERASTVSSMATSDNDDDRAGFLPMAFDPNPAPGPPPLSSRRTPQRDELEHAPRLKENLSPSPKDYFNKIPRPTHLDRLSSGRPSSSRSVSTEREGVNNGAARARSPHVAFQDKAPGQQRPHTSGHSTPVSSNLASPAGPPGQINEKQERPRPSHLSSQSYTLGASPSTTEPFKLQEVPKDRKLSRTSARSSTRSPPTRSPATLETLNQARYEPPSDQTLPSSPASLDTPSSSFNPFDDPKLRDPTSAPPSSTRIPTREDSLPSSARNDRDAASTSASASASASKVTSPASTPSMRLEATHERKESATSSQSAQYVDAPSPMPADVNKSTQQSLDSPLKSANSEAPVAPPRAASRPSAPSKSVGNNDDFIAPRAPPPPPTPQPERSRNESVSTSHSDVDRSAFTQASPQPSWRGHLPKHSGGGEFSMEEEMARILRGEDRDKRQREGSDSSASVLRRVSNAVKHGRSFSDKSAGMHQKTPTLGSIEISSPIAIGSPMSPSASSLNLDQSALLVHLRRAQQRIAELEADKVALEERVNSSVDIKQVNTELREKRSTMAFLDTQREMVVRELEVMTNHLSKAKDTNQPLDIQVLKSEVLQDFARSLQKLKDSLGSQIEDLVHKRNELTDEIGSLIQVKDKGLQEFESLSQKNQQLAELNNQLVTSIQEMYKANAGRLPHHPALDRSPLPNGLGIYTGGRGDLSDLNSMKSGSLPESSSLHNLIPEAGDAEPATILTAPKVVDIRKAQPKKFWKKGSGGIGKSVTKGLKGAFANNNNIPMNPKDGSYDLNGMPYSQMQTGPGALVMGDAPMNARQDQKGGFGFFSSGQKNGLKPGSMSNNLKNSSSTNLPSESATILFGSDLRERCDYENRIIPAIVTRCIEEVELRGMDMEGIYRKSGGSGQVKTIQQGFEKDNAYDITDPDLDIHAVTSALKQYFRKLPNPLITYESYDGFLHAGQIGDKEKQRETMRAAVETLPGAHRDVLEFLIHHLGRVVKMESENLMTPLNLAVVFAPTIMRPLSIEREMSDMQAQRMAVQALLEHAEFVFDPSEG